MNDKTTETSEADGHYESAGTKKDCKSLEHFTRLSFRLLKEWLADLALVDAGFDSPERLFENESSLSLEDIGAARSCNVDWVSDWPNGNKTIIDRCYRRIDEIIPEHESGIENLSFKIYTTLWNWMAGCFDNHCDIATDITDPGAIVEELERRLSQRGCGEQPQILCFGTLPACYFDAFSEFLEESSASSDIPSERLTISGISFIRDNNLRNKNCSLVWGPQAVECRFVKQALSTDEAYSSSFTQGGVDLAFVSRFNINNNQSHVFAHVMMLMKILDQSQGLVLRFKERENGLE